MSRVIGYLMVALPVVVGLGAISVHIVDRYGWATLLFFVGLTLFAVGWAYIAAGLILKGLK